jgi:arylsulfatase A-like enzyme
VKQTISIVAFILALVGCSREAPPPVIEAAAAQIVNPPNVVLIVADSLGILDTSLVEGGEIPTPNLKQLAADGVNFTLGYAASSANGPSRAGLITGSHPSRIGYEYDNGPGERDEREQLGLPLGEATLGTALSSAKYATGYFGRWGLGGMSVHYPTNRGYGEFYGVLSNSGPHVAPSVAARMSDILTIASPQFPAVLPFDKYSRSYSGADSDSAENADRYSSLDYTDKALDFIARHTREPFFVTLALPTPSAPLQVPSNYHAKFPGISDPARRVYAAQVAVVDDSVGKIMAALTKAGIAENTLVIFTAATGCNPESGACSCAGLRGGAITLYDGGTRVPLVMRWPQGIPKSTVFARPISLVDIYPTILAATGAERPAAKKFDGINILPYANGKKSGDPHETLVWMRRPAVAMRTENWKIISDPIEKTMQLFDLAKDPNEETDLAKVRTDVLKRLQTQIEVAGTFSGDPLWRSRERATLNYCQESLRVYR